MLALLLVVALTFATITLARRLELLGDVIGVIGASVAAGLLWIAVHPELELLAEPPDDADASCGSDEIPLVAPVVERVSLSEARALIEDEVPVTFIDARPSYHYTAAHIPGAINLPADDAEGLLDTQSLPIPPDGQIITYCDGGTCEQSEYLGMVLRERDVCQRVRVLEGGWQAWVADEGPSVTGSNRFGEAPTSSIDGPEVAG